MIYMLTHGEYGDYTIDGVYEGPDGLDLKQLRIEFEEVWNEMKGDVSKREDAYYLGDGLKPDSERETFEKWLVTMCGLKSVETTEWWTGSYWEVVAPHEIKEN